MTGFLADLFFVARRRPAVALLLALAAGLGVANYFLWKQRSELTREYDASRARGQRVLTALVDRDRINSDLARLREGLGTIDQNLVVEADMEVNLGYFYRIEKLTRVRLTQLSQLSTPPSPEGNKFKTIPVSLRATGTYPQLMNFLRQLETGPRLVVVRGFSFGTVDPKTSAMSLDLTVDMLGS